MKKVLINLELDIKRNPEYKLIQDIYKKSLQDIKCDIRSPFSAGQHSERNYSIRHDQECTNKDNEYINTLANIHYSQHEKMYNELLELKKENIALKKALKENNISVTITHLKYYGDNEEVAM